MQSGEEIKKPGDITTQDMAKAKLYGNMAGPITQTQKGLLRTGSKVWNGVASRIPVQCQLLLTLPDACTAWVNWQRLKRHLLKRNFKEQWSYWKWKAWGKKTIAHFAIAKGQYQIMMVRSSCGLRYLLLTLLLLKCWLTYAEKVISESYAHSKFLFRMQSQYNNMISVT